MLIKTISDFENMAGSGCTFMILPNLQHTKNGKNGTYKTK